MFGDGVVLKWSGNRKAPGIKLSDGIFVVGRSRTCDLILPDSSVSRSHAELSVQGGLVRVNDLNSRNGTYVNENRVQSCDLPVGCELRFGNVSFVVEANR